MFGMIGDIHLGALANSLPSLPNKQLKTLHGIANRARKMGISDLVLAGDVFDLANPNNRLVIMLIKFLLRHPDIHWHILMGNHDWDSIEVTSLDIPSYLGTLDAFNLTVYREPQTIELGGIKVFMCPHPHLVDMPRDCEWAIGHFAWNGALAENGRPVKSGNAPRGRWLLGDFHTPQEGERYVYAGSMTQIKWDEDTDKSWLVVEEDNVYRRIRHKLAYQLRMKRVYSEDDLTEVTEDRESYWSLHMMNGFVLPARFIDDNPQVVNQTARTDQKKTKAAQLLAETTTESIHRPRSALTAYLDKRDVPAKLRQDAVTLAEQMFVELGLGG